MGRIQKAVEEHRQTLIHAADALDGFKNRLEQVAKTEDLIKQWKNQKDALDKLIKGTEDYDKAAEDLRETERLLADGSDGFVSKYEAENGIRQETIDLLTEQLKIEREIIELQRQKFLSDFTVGDLEAEVKRLTTAYEEQRGKLEGQITQRQTLTNLLGEYQKALIDANMSEEETAEIFGRVTAKADKLGQSYNGVADAAEYLWMFNDAAGKKIDEDTEKWKKTGEELNTASGNLERYNSYLEENTAASGKSAEQLETLERNRVADTNAMFAALDAQKKLSEATEQQALLSEQQKLSAEEQIGLWDAQTEAGWRAAEALKIMTGASEDERAEAAERVKIGKEAVKSLQDQVEAGKDAAKEWKNLEDKESEESEILLTRIALGEQAAEALEAQTEAQKAAQKATEDYCKAAAKAYDDYYNAATDALKKIEEAEIKGKKDKKLTEEEKRVFVKRKL